MVCATGRTINTPGLSEHRSNASTFYSNDKQGNLWTQNAADGAQTYYTDFTAFGAMTAGGGSTSTPFKFGGGNGCQSDADTGLVLMGHRYYDPRTGRFLTQDPAGDGDNWYAYAGNNPVNDTDPSGLVDMGSGPSPFEQMASGGAGTLQGNLDFLGGDYTETTYHFQWQQVHMRVDGQPEWVDVPGSLQLTSVDSTTFDIGGMSEGMGMGGAMFADGPSKPRGRPESYEPGVENEQRGVWKNYKNGDREFEPDPSAPVKKKGHGDGGRNQGADEEHSINAKGNRTPRSTGGGMRRFSPLIYGAGAVGAGYFLYQGVKDAVAVLGIPETGGASLVLLFAP